jgi:hypothetical protein
MNPRRPDYTGYMRLLNLSGHEDPLEMLAGTEGRRRGDTIQLFPEPRVATDGTTSFTFLVHGVRHVLDDDPDAEANFAGLQVGDELQLQQEFDNPVDPRAMLVTAADERLGWVPNPLLPFVLEVTGAELSVAHVNGPDAPPHYRVLVRLNGQAEPGRRPFDGPDWEPANRS